MSLPVHLHFQERPYDIAACVVYTFAVSAVILVVGSGNPTMLIAVAFVPGYLLLAAVYPGSDEIPWAQRIAFSFVVSIATLSLIGLLLDMSPYGMGFESITLSIVLFALVVGVVAHVRRIHLPAAKRLALTLNLNLPRWNDYSRYEKLLTAALTGGIVLTASALVYEVTTPPAAGRFTEFYMLGPGGVAAGYPTRLNVSETGSVILGIANHEYSTVRYTVLAVLIGESVVFNATTGANQTLAVNLTTISWTNVTLDNGQGWTQVFDFKIDAVGLWQVQFLLFRNGNFALAYRSLHLYVTVP